ncbi:hypothetical protein KY084_11645 [Stakelama sp. CBK3Z-3]|uniref:DUF4175 domain-containing protein n=1 Tax=Stakelama flava TaxID=2860338 RepID=A0ABS6XMZ6_9SPHN|nr:hypothetical protein [Stakelama flava]MBW4331521.1 hypothetical protein [Stakelama flava]
MFNLLSLFTGMMALVLALVGLMPLLGWLNWAAVPLAVIGAALGMVSSGRSGRNLNLLVILVGVCRLALGGGIF